MTSAVSYLCILINCAKVKDTNLIIVHVSNICLIHVTHPPAANFYQDCIINEFFSIIMVACNFFLFSVYHYVFQYLDFCNGSIMYNLNQGF